VFSFSVARIIITVERKSHYYVLNIILPTIMLSILSLMTFVLPTESGEKIALSVSLLLSYFVFLQVVQENNPKSSDYTSILSTF